MMNQYKVHHVKFYQPDVTPIHCLAFEDSTNKLALSRSDNSVEIWDLSAKPYHESSITGNKDESIEALAWCDDRLFSTGLHGYILEYDLKKLIVKHREPVFSSSAWCLSLNHAKSHFAVGTENGDICIFEILPEKIRFIRTLDKQENRTLCLSWHESDAFIVTGSLDVIQVWNVETGHSVQRITTGRTSKGHETIVWCVQILKDFTIVSGDSRGKVCFWNGKTGSLIESIQSHKADVLTVAVSKDEDKIFFSGIDPLIVQFSRVSSHHDLSTKRNKWIRTYSRNIHTHDVRAMVFAKDFLVSGGVDTYLVLSKYSPKLCLKYHQFCHKKGIHVARSARCVMLQYKTYIEIWKFGQTNHSSENNGDELPLFMDTQKLLELQAKGESTIICCAISDNASWISFSTKDRLKLFVFSKGESGDPFPKVSLTPVLTLPNECKSAHQLLFTPDSRRLLIATENAEIQIVTLDVLQPTLLHVFPPMNDSIHLMSISNDGKYAAAANHKSRIQVYDLTSLQSHCSVPHYKHQPSTLNFHPACDKLIAVYTDHKVIEFDLLNKEYTDWSRNQNLESQYKWRNQNQLVTNILFDHENHDKIFMQTDSTISLIDKSKVDDHESENKSKSRKQEKEAKKIVESHQDVKMCKKYKHLLYFGNVEKDEMVAVELLPSSIFDKLPSALKQKKFGT